MTDVYGTAYQRVRWAKRCLDPKYGRIVAGMFFATYHTAYPRDFSSVFYKLFKVVNSSKRYRCKSPDGAIARLWFRFNMKYGSRTDTGQATQTAKLLVSS